MTIKTAAFLLLLSVAGVASAHAASATALRCTTDRLRELVTPTHVPDTWPVVKELPDQFRHTLGMLLAPPGEVVDGYTYRTYIDTEENTVYVTQQGGFAGSFRVFGPFPITDCPSNEAARADAQTGTVTTPRDGSANRNA